MRGTGYAIVEIIWWMLAAAAVGFFIGWILRRWSGARELESLWEERFESEHHKAERLAENLAAREATIASLESDLSAARRRVEGLQADFDAKAGELEAALAASPLLPTPDGGTAVDAGAPAPGAASPQPNAEPRAPGSAAGLPDKETATLKVAEIAARTRGDGPRVDDDLQQIRGVGPKLEQLLKDLDITSFKQVANFTTDDIAFVTAALDAFPGRIQRDDWMSSAAQEHLKKYGEPAR